MRNSHDAMQQYLDQAIHDLRILSGDIVGPSDVTWQDVAGTAVCNLENLANQIRRCREGVVPFPVFPEVRVLED